MSAISHKKSEKQKQMRLVLEGTRKQMIRKTKAKGRFLKLLRPATSEASDGNDDK